MNMSNQGLEAIGRITDLARLISPMDAGLNFACEALGLPPEMRAAAKVAMGVMTGNVLMVVDGALEAGQAAQKKEPARTEYVPAQNGELQSQGYAACSNKPRRRTDRRGNAGRRPKETKPVESQPCPTPSSATSHSARPPPGQPCAVPVLPEPPPSRQAPEPSHHWDERHGSLDPNILEYQDALKTLCANWEVFDTAGSVADGYLTREDLKVILNNPNAHPILKKAADFLLSHPEYFNRLEMAARGGGKDSVVGRCDVEADLARVEDEIETHGIASAPNASAPEPHNRFAGILKDPSLSIDEKVEMLLAELLESLDEEVLQVTEELSAAQKGEGKATKGENKPSAEQLQLKLQKLMERRKQMFDLMSNMSSKFNEMARTAIGNLARA